MHSMEGESTTVTRVMSLADARPGVRFEEMRIWVHEVERRKQKEWRRNGHGGWWKSHSQVYAYVSQGCCVASVCDHVLRRKVNQTN